MWFDAQRALADLGGDDLPPDQPAPESVAHVAHVARPLPSKRPALDLTETVQDGATYLAFLANNGPATYGAAAVALGWGATRAWRAEAGLLAAGVAILDRLGRACPCA